MSWLSWLDRRLGRAPRGWSAQATPEDVDYAYRLILGRPPDPAGRAHYRALVARGLPLDALVRSFVHSDEARARTDAESRTASVDLGGYRVCVQTRDRDFAQAIIATNDYEPHVRNAVRERLRAGDVAVDVGANVGCIALLASRLVGAGGLVAAIEPNPDNLQMLYAGIVLNGAENVRVLPYAASTGPQVFSLAGGVSNTHLVAAREPDRKAAYAQSVVLDEALAWLPRLDLVKMDVEGHEPQAFEGFRRSLERRRPALVVEFNPRCLVDLGRHEPAAFAEQILALYPRVRALSAFGDDEPFERAADLMDYWRRRNREVTDAGLLPDGLLHFDLVAERGRPR